MDTFTITLEQISTGIRSASMVVRKETEAQAREYAETAIRQSATPDDLRVVEIVAR